VKTVLQKLMPYILILHTDAHAVCGQTKWCRVFSEWAVPRILEPESWKASQTCKVQIISHEITNEPYLSSNYENTITNTRRTPHMLKKSRSLVKTVNTTSKVVQTANWIMMLTKASWNSKVKYLSLALPLNIQFLLLMFIGFNCTIWYCAHNHYCCTSDHDCSLRMELYLLDEYS